jgi:hypothetical protein
MKLDIDQLKAEEIEDLIRTLALKRATMKPEVPNSPDWLLQEGDKHVLIEDSPALSIRARAHGGYRIWIRNRGIGWLAFEIDDQTGATLRDFLRKHSGEGPPVDFVIHRNVH